MSSKPRFVISKRGVLEKCYGPEGEVVIPEGVTIIGDIAFSYSGLTSVTIPESVKRIGCEAFAHCNKLTGVTIPRDIDIRISSNAFVDTPWRKSLGEVAVLNHVLLDYQAHEGLYSQWDEHIEVTIPENVKVIGDYAFKLRHALSGVTIPEGVTKIDECAFGEGFCNGPCENLTIHAPAGSCAERYAGKKGFGFVAEGEAVTENVQDFIIKNGVLTKYDGSGGNVTIPAGVTVIRYQAFDGFKKLTGVTIPKSVAEIGEKSFARCTGLASVTLLGSAAKIDKTAFEGCCPVIIAPHIPIDNFAPAVRPDAVRGFARLYLEGVELDEEIRIGYLKYIKGNKKRLYPTVIEDEALLRLMLAEKLVTKNDIQPLLDEADKQGNTAAKAALLGDMN